MARTHGLVVLRRALIAALREQPASGPPRRVRKSAISRRAFLKAGAATAVVAATAGGLRLPASAQGARVAIIGAGMAGLSAAWHLAEAGADVVVLERGGRVGGRVFSAPATFAPELVLDLGGSFVNTDHADMLALIEAMRLTLYDRSRGNVAGVEPDAFLLDGRRFEEAEVAGAVAPLAEAIARDAALLDEDWDAHAAAIDGQSVAAYLDANFAGAPAWARLVIESTIRSEYGVEPGEASALELIWLMPSVDGERVELLGSSDEAFVVQEGSGALPVALAAALGERVRTGVAIEAITDTGEAVEITDGGGTTERYDRAVIAVPLRALRAIRLEAELPETFRQMVEAGRLGHNEKLIAGFRGRPWLEAKAFSHAALVGEPFTATWYATQRQSEAANSGLTFFLGGDQAIGLGAERPGAQRERFVDVLEPNVAGLAAASLDAEVRTDWGRQVGGAYTNFAPGFYTSFGGELWAEPDDGPASGPAFGNLAFAGEHLSDDFVGYMNGAAQTGRLAAAAITG